VADRITHEAARSCVRSIVTGDAMANSRTLLLYISQQESLDSARPGTEPPLNDDGTRSDRFVLALAELGSSTIWEEARHDGLSWVGRSPAGVMLIVKAWRELPEVPRG
jgi:hypothetical protein